MICWSTLACNSYSFSGGNCGFFHLLEEIAGSFIALEPYSDNRSALFIFPQKSDNVRLAEHVGHKVKVDGVVSNQPFHGMKEDLKAEMEKAPIETGVLTVTNLEMVSDSCN